MPQRCIVIGASAGGFQVLVETASQLPADLPVPVFIVMHVPAYQPSHLAYMLSKAGPLPALHPEDGASGLWSIKRLGGTAIVQDLYEAEYASMPRSALEYVEADHEVRSREIGALLTRLAHEQPEEEIRVGTDVGENLESRIAKEVQIATGTNLSYQGILEPGELTSLTCPECHGFLIRIV